MNDDNYLTEFEQKLKSIEEFIMKSLITGRGVYDMDTILDILDKNNLTYCNALYDYFWKIKHEDWKPDDVTRRNVITTSVHDILSGNAGEA